MDDVTTPVISGIVVLLAGLLAFIVVVGGEADQVETNGAGTALGAVTFSELDLSVERVLLGTGDAWIYPSDTGTGLPAELARVLDAYQVPLMIPIGDAR
ncbi:hypothetical protein BH23ACT4_BH23ACT4_12120 [soil metagenome]